MSRNKNDKRSEVRITQGGKDIFQGEHVSVNIESHLIVVSEDKARLCLREHLKRLERRKQWLLPVGLLVSLMATLVSSDFRSAFGL